LVTVVRVTELVGERADAHADAGRAAAVRDVPGDGEIISEETSELQSGRGPGPREGTGSWRREVPEGNA
jgi:hypothetical protein